MKPASGTKSKCCKRLYMEWMHVGVVRNDQVPISSCLCGDFRPRSRSVFPFLSFMFANTKNHRLLNSIAAWRRLGPPAKKCSKLVS